MNHSRQGRQFFLDPFQHRGHSVRVCDVREFNAHPHASLAQARDRCFLVRIRRPTTVQNNRAGALVRQPACHQETDSPEAAGDQECPVFPQPPACKGRHRKHDVVLMPPGAGGLDSRSRFHERARAAGKRLQRALRHVGHQGAERRAHPRRLILCQAIQC